VTGDNGGAAGGLVGQIGGPVQDSYATGPVTCGNNCATGGLVGWAEDGGSLLRSFASGPVTAGKDGAAGGLAGYSTGTVRQVYATGPVTTGAGTSASLIAAKGGHVAQVFAAGRLRAAAGSFKGGLFAVREPPDQALANAYWDVGTTTQTTSNGGAAKTTTQLRAAKPAGFLGAWDIVAGASYPYLTSAALDFKSTLATLVRANLIYTFVPIGQLEITEYAVNPKHADEASLAAVYTMLARAVAVTSKVGALNFVRIDRYFWNDATAAATFGGPITQHVTLGALRAIPAATPLNEQNVVGPLRNGHPVILRGSYQSGDNHMKVTVRHWLLATLFTNDANNRVERIVVNDPLTGKQALIDPATKKVVSPAKFPLPDMTIDAYRIVTLR
jgi:hypothetical protein